MSFFSRRHQLKPILEAAKSLQVKGLSEADPSDILSRQVLPGTSSTAAAMAHRFKQVTLVCVDCKRPFV